MLMEMFGKENTAVSFFSILTNQSNSEWVLKDVSTASGGATPAADGSTQI